MIFILDFQFTESRSTMDLLLFTWVVVATLSTHTHVEGSVLKNLMHLEPRTGMKDFTNTKNIH